MEDKNKHYSKELLGKTIVSKSGKKFGEVGDLIFEVGSGELIHLLLKNPTVYTDKMELEKTKDGQILIP
ncbi:PRC-barrel domain-containing protein, partial [Candidatus Woesearchaeota archaeon]|nr:PRC-barrel domain-containing protein [Candidatus Woesearchaeota archaeon]